MSLSGGDSGSMLHTPVAVTVRMPRRVSDFSGAQTAILSFALVLLASIPIWTYPIPPLSDYANHLARMYVIAKGAADVSLSRYYEVDWQIIPNLMMDLVVPVLGRFMSIYLAGQVFTFLAFLMIISGAIALNRSLFGHWSAFPLVTVPLLFNSVYLIGVMNYVFGIGVALWALALWILLRDKPWLLRIAVSTLCVVVAFFCHLFALGLYGMALLAFEITQLWRTRHEPLPPRLVRFFASGIPFLVVVPLLVASPTLTLATENTWEPRGKIDGLMYIFVVYSDLVAFAVIATIAAGLIWCARHRLLRIHPVGWTLLMVGTIVYMAMPRILFASYMADQRLPIALAFMMAGCLDLKLHHRTVRRAFIAVVLMLLVMRVIEVNVFWSQLSSITAEFRSSVKRIRPGSKILVAYAEVTAGDDVRDLGLVHAACIAMIERSSLVTTAFTVPGKQVLHVRPEYRGIVDTEDGTPPSVAQLLLATEREETATGKYWEDWESNFDYLYVLFTEDEAKNPDPDRLTLVQDGDRFQLYRIKKPA
jgi:hypothetical protein